MYSTKKKGEVQKQVINLRKFIGAYKLTSSTHLAHTNLRKKEKNFLPYKTFGKVRV